MKEKEAILRLRKRLKELKDSYDLSVAQSFETEKQSGIKFLTFALDNEVYAWPVSHTSEILEYRGITPIPGDMPLLHGIVNNKNRIVCVVNLHRLFQLTQPQCSTTSRLIFTKNLGEEQAFLVDRLMGVYLINTEQFSFHTPVREKNISKYIKGAFYLEDTLVSVLVPEAFQSESSILNKD
ncbi:chemotaxis protein CheW [Desulfobulbus rhabdoformis]|uniref:chemotaxis protein CheW n=1 Tax=Desulfobulbus rhabdoformis TaxID=34032 RepID=UPI0019657CF2|nr:chemotaxis protein CheW [Desulfobulbus rhabdoformis]MBM9614121.1 chemotaxis protein CheW [Desulfobulbus rhabdoformis]